MAGGAIEIEDASKCNQCIECYRFAEKMNEGKCVKIGEDDQKFFFTVESTGALPPEEIVRKALIILKAKIEKFKQELIDNTVENKQYNVNF